jgi:Leucine-rich repeat (LRR) protein
MLKKYGKSLTFLSLANNNITYINESILSSFSHLADLDLTGNLLRPHFPSVHWLLVMLDKRKIHENNIKAFMSPICHLPVIKANIKCHEI